MENINYNIVSLIDFLGLIQGIFLGNILIFRNRKSTASLLLGLFLMAFCLELLPAIIKDLNLLTSNSSLLFLPINFYYITSPLFFLYVKRITNLKLSRKEYLILIPGIIEFVLFTILFILSKNIKIQLFDISSIIKILNIYEFVALPYAIYFAARTLIYLKKHKDNVENYYSNIDGRLLTWAKWVALFIIMQDTWLILIFNVDNDFDGFTYLSISIINVVFIFWVGISGLQQTRFLALSSLTSTNENHYIDVQMDKNKEGNSFSEPEDYKLLKQLMQEEYLYKEPDLSLADLSKRLNMSQRNLSQLINQHSNKNFNKFINEYRVEEAKKLLKDKSNNNLNMLGIAYKSGFNSKASFYAVFKQFTRITPNTFKKQAPNS